MKAHQKFNMFSSGFSMAVAIVAVVLESYVIATINIAFSVSSFFLARE